MMEEYVYNPERVAEQRSYQITKNEAILFLKQAIILAESQGWDKTKFPMKDEEGNKFGLPLSELIEITVKFMEYENEQPNTD